MGGMHFVCELCGAVVPDTEAHRRDSAGHEEATFRPLELPPDGFED